MIYKKLLSIFISFIMLFNLTADIFAAPNMVSREQQNQITSVLTEAHKQSKNKTSNNSNAQNIRNRYKRAKENYAVALVKYQYAKALVDMAESIKNSYQPSKIDDILLKIHLELYETFQTDPELAEKLYNEKFEQYLKDADPELLEEYKEELVRKTNIYTNFITLNRYLFQDNEDYNDYSGLYPDTFNSNLSIFSFATNSDSSVYRGKHIMDYYEFDKKLENAKKAYTNAEDSLLSYLQYAYKAELDYRIENQCKKAQDYYKHIAEGYNNIKNGQLFRNSNFYLSAAQKQDSNIQGLAKWDTEVYKRCNSGIVYLDEDFKNFEEDMPFKTGWLTPDEFLTLLAQEYYEEYVPKEKKTYEDTWLTPYYSVIYEGQKNLLKQNYIINKGKEKGKEIFLLLLADYDLGYMQYITTLAKISLAKRAYQYLLEQEENDTLAYPEKISVQGYKMDRYYYQRYANTEKQERISKANIFSLVDRTENYALEHLIELSAGLVKAMYLENKTPIQYLEQIGITKQDILDAYNNYKQQQLELLEEKNLPQDDSLKTDEELASTVAQLGNIDYTGITKQNIYMKYLHKELWEEALDYLFVLAPSTHLANNMNKQIAQAEFNRQIKHQDSHNRPIFNQLLTLLSEHKQGWIKGLNPIVNDILKNDNSAESNLALDREALFFLTELAVTHEASDPDLRAKLINKSMYVQNAEGAVQGAGFVLQIGADLIVGKALALAKATKFARRIKTQIKNLKIFRKIEASIEKLDTLADARRQARNGKQDKKLSSKQTNEIFEDVNNKPSSSGNSVTNESKPLANQEKPSSLPKENVSQDAAGNTPSEPTSPTGPKSDNTTTNTFKNQIKKSYNTIRKKVVKVLIIINLLNPFALSSSEAKTIIKGTNIETIVQEAKNEEKLLNALDNNPTSLEQGMNRDVWISDRPNSSATITREKEPTLPKIDRTEGGPGPKPTIETNPTTPKKGNATQPKQPNIEGGPKSKTSSMEKGNKAKKSSVEIKTKNELIAEAQNKPKTEFSSPKGNESFVQEMNKGEVKPVGSIRTKEIATTPQELQNDIDNIIRTYEEKGAIVYEEDLRNIINSEKGPGGLLEHVIIPEKLNTNSWNIFYNNLKHAVLDGDVKAAQFYDRYISNMLKPDRMIVFDYPINIPGMNPNYKTAISIEKIIGAQSNRAILTLTNDGLKVINAHKEPVGKNIYQLLTGDVKSVFVRQEAGGQLREFVILDWEENIPNAIIIETDEAKGVNVIVTNYHPKNANGLFKELNKTAEINGTTKNLYRKALYIDEKSAGILNNLNKPK